MLVAVRVPGAERLHRRPGMAHLRVCPGLHGSRAGAGHLLGHPTDRAFAALGDRGTHPRPHRPAQHLRCPVAGGQDGAGPVGRRRGTADDAVRPARHRLHPTVPLRGRLQWRRGGHRLLPDHRVRAAARRRAGTGSRSPAPPAHRGHHGPDHDRVAARVGRPRDRHRGDGVVRAVARQPHPDPIRLRRAESSRLRARLRLRPDVVVVVADRNAGAGGALRAQARRGGRSGLQRRGVRRHRVGRAAAWLQLDGRRATRTRTCAGPVRPPRRARGGRGRRTAAAEARRRGTPRRGDLRRHHRLHTVGDRPGPRPRSSTC